MRLGCGWGAVRMGSHTNTVMIDLSQASSVDCSKGGGGFKLTISLWQCSYKILLNYKIECR